MDKLQLYITKSLRGYKTLLNINATQEVQTHIHDYRAALESIDYDNSRSNVFYLLTYLEQGLIVTVIRTIAASTDRGHMAASVFIPNGVHLSPVALVTLGTMLSAAIDTDGGELHPESIAILEEYFAKTYRAEANPPSRLPSSGKHYGFAYYGGIFPSLKAYAESRFYQPQFSRFAGVILIDSAHGAKGRDKDADLSREALTPSIELLPPDGTKGGFVPHIYHHVFRSPLLVPAGGELEIQWKQPGFDTVTQKITLPATGPVRLTAPEVASSHKTISPASFYITEHGTHRTVGAFMIKVNGREIEGPVNFTHSELEHAKVEIAAPGYLSFSGELDLASTTQALVQMHLLHRTYRFDVPLKTSDSVNSVRIYLKSKKPITESPLDGYAVTGGSVIEGAGVTNKLVYVGGHSSQAPMRFVGAIALGFVLGLIVAWALL